MSDDDWGDGSGDDWENAAIPTFGPAPNLDDCPTFSDEDEDLVEKPVAKPAGPKKASGLKPKHARKKKEAERAAKIAAFEARRQAVFDDLGGEEDMDGMTEKEKQARLSELADNAICDDLFSAEPAAAAADVKVDVKGLNEASGDTLNEILGKLTLVDEKEHLLFAKQFADKMVESNDPILLVGALKEVLRIVKPVLTSKDFQDLASFTTMQKNKKKKEESKGIKAKKKKKKGPVAKTMRDNDWMGGGGYENEYADYDDFM